MAISRPPPNKPKHCFRLVIDYDPNKGQVVQMHGPMRNHMLVRTILEEARRSLDNASERLAGGPPRKTGLFLPRMTVLGPDGKPAKVG